MMDFFLKAPAQIINKDIDIFGGILHIINHKPL